MSDNDIVILSAVRTAQGRFQGGFAGTPAQELGAVAMAEALKRAGVAGDQLDEVIFGNVIQAGLGQNVARQAELKAGIPDSVPAITVNRVCVSSASALAMAAATIKAGDGDVYLVGGTENMTRAPWVLQNGRSGYRMGMPTDKMYDSMVLDGLWCAVNDYHMGVTAENLSERFGISKEAQNEVAYQSQLNATAAIKDGRFKDEIVPVVIPQRKGDPKVVDTDECPRETTPGDPRRPQARLQEGRRRRDRRQRLGDRRRRQRRGRHVPQEGRGARRQADRPARQLRDRRLRARHHGLRRDGRRASRPREGRPDQQGRAAGRAQRGLRLRRRPRDSRARPRAATSSTSTAARSLSATRSATQARG